MKTRIISGLVMAIIVAGALTLGFVFDTTIIIAAVALLAVIAIYELVHNAVGIHNAEAFVGACLFAALFTLIHVISNNFSFSLTLIFIISLAYEIFAVIIILKNFGKYSLGKIMAFFAFPIVYGVAFFCLCGIIINPHGIYYLLLLLNFSSVCDMGAYFVGVKFGSHKLCKKVSPKKTVEGAVGGIVSSVIVSAILAYLFNKAILITLALTVPFCILGMLGDLFASVIKRLVDIKDYGKLIPGHGGVMDRLDSILMISPLMYVLTIFSVI